MDINAENLNALNTAVSTAFNKGRQPIKPQYERIATVVQSKGAANTYPFLGDSGVIREWLGPRVIQRLKTHDYTLKNRKFEKTQGIPVDVYNDDQFGTFMPLFENLGADVAEFPDRLAFPLLGAGFTTKCYDEQNFFDTDHPVGNEGEEVSVSNMQAGAGAPWFLLCTRKPLKPLIFQDREKFELVKKFSAQQSDHTFINDELLWGVKGRCEVGFALWQLAFGSKATLDQTNFDLAYAAMMGFKNDAGAPLGIIPDLLVCGPANRSKAKQLIEAMLINGGDSNPNYQAVELLVVPWLT